MSDPLQNLARLRNARAGRASSWDKSGRNNDAWHLAAGETRVLADIKGPGCITHLWMTQRNHYRECLLKITWDNARSPSVLCPLGDFFGLGHNIVKKAGATRNTPSPKQGHYHTICLHTLDFRLLNNNSPVWSD